MLADGVTGTALRTPPSTTKVNEPADKAAMICGANSISTAGVHTPGWIGTLSKGETAQPNSWEENNFSD